MPRSSPEADPWGRRVRLGLPRALARPYGRKALTRVRFICGRSAPAAHLRRHAAPLHDRRPAAAPHLLLLRPARLLTAHRPARA